MDKEAASHALEKQRLEFDLKSSETQISMLKSVQLENKEL